LFSFSFDLAFSRIILFFFTFLHAVANKGYYIHLMYSGVDWSENDGHENDGPKMMR